MTPRKPRKHWYDFFFKDINIEAGGGKKFKAPVLAVFIILVIAGIVAILLFSDWRCGKWFTHDASDVPVKKEMSR